jgi:hypothetical protein
MLSPRITRLQTPLFILAPSLLFFGIAALIWPIVEHWQGDVKLYFNYSLELAQGKLPYRDVRLEYPPLAIVPFVVPRLLALGQMLSEDQYRWLFLAQNAVYCAFIAWGITLVYRRVTFEHSLATALLIYAALLVVFSAVLPWRYDIFPAFLTALALFAVVDERPVLAGVWLGLGIAAKLYPVVLVPICGLYYLAWRQWQPLARLSLGCGIALIVSIVPFWLIGSEGLLAFLRYHGLRGIQVESVSGGVIMLLQVLGAAEVSTTFNYGALHLVSPIADAVVGWHTPMFILAYLVLMLIAYRGFRTDVATLGSPSGIRLVTYSVAALLVFIVTNKVFSPQYLVWLLPFVPLLRPRHALVLFGVFVATTVIFPFWYEALLRFETVPVLLLNVRNFATVGLIIWLLIDVLRPAQAARIAGREVLV